MTANAQRIAIAKLLGLRPQVSGYMCSLTVGSTPTVLLDCPDYPKCRNAMSKALRTLDDEEWPEYMLKLCDIAGTLDDAGKWATARALLAATPAQQAEAFLKVKGKWADDEP